MALFNKVPPDPFHSHHHETELWVGLRAREQSLKRESEPQLPWGVLNGGLAVTFARCCSWWDEITQKWLDTASPHCPVRVWPDKESAHITCWPSDIVCVLVCVMVIHSRLTLCDCRPCSWPGSSVHGILQARMLRWVAMPICRGSSQPRDQTWVFWIADRFFTVWATRRALVDAPNCGKELEQRRPRHLV